MSSPKPSSRRWVKRLILSILALPFILGFCILLIILLGSDSRPVGVEGAQADALARSLMSAVDHSAWQRTGAVRWDFGGRQEHLWDRRRQWARVRWGSHEALFDLATRQGLVRREGRPVAGEDVKELLETAWAHWCNDSFWLNPLAKLFDEGVVRTAVELEGGGQGLLVQYTSGGVTPGDSYLWIPGADGLPERWRMWTQIIPVGGLGASWEDWITLETGARVATKHRIAVLNLRLSDVAGAVSLAELEPGEDPFAELAQFLATI